MKKMFTLILLIFSFSSFASCPLEFSALNLCARLKWVDGPHLDQKSYFELKFWDREDQSETAVDPYPYEVKIYSWMTMSNGHHHGGPRFNVERPTPGLYIVRDARFFMGHMNGFWEIRIDLLEEDKVVFNKQVEVIF